MLISFEDEADDFGDKMRKSFEQQTLLHFLYKNFSLFEKAMVIHSNNHKGLLYHKIHAITEEDDNVLIELKNSSNKVVATITQNQLAKAKRRGKEMIIPQSSDNQQLKLKLLFLKNILDNS